jgi:hypothetical protein
LGVGFGCMVGDEKKYKYSFELVFRVI